jgi:hypothetical protein
MPNYGVNKSLLLYHCYLILCIIVYKIYVKQYIAILLHFIPLKIKKYQQNIYFIDTISWNWLITFCYVIKLLFEKHFIVISLGDCQNWSKEFRPGFRPE